MATLYNTPVLRYVIETSNPQGEVLAHWAIDQTCGNVNDRRQVERIDNQIEGHLHSLYLRTGLTYKRLWSGHPETVNRYLKEFKIKLG